MGKLVRCITGNGQAVAIAVDSTDIVSEAERIHKTSAVVTAALGRLLTAASMMGNMLKGEKDSITLRIAGDGPVGSLIAVVDSKGDVRGYAVNPVVELPLNNKGKLDVGSAVGKNGTLYVIKDLGMKEPYSGSVALVSGEIAEDITAYYALSEQTPTVCALGVLVNPDLSVKAAGGYIVQLLPSAEEETISKLEDGIKEIESVTAMLSKGMSPEDILRRVLKNFETEVLDENKTEYKCNCSRERFKNALASIETSELESMAEDLPEIKAECHFCNRVYEFSKEEIKQLIKNKKTSKNLQKSVDK